MPTLDTEGLPYADYVTVGMCTDEKCGQLHVILFKNEKPIAVGVIDDVKSHLDAIQKWAYIAATRRSV